PNINEWDQFIRAPQTTEQPIETVEETTEEGNEKKGIPSIFKNLFKARKKKHISIAESTKVEPSLAEQLAQTADDTMPETITTQPTITFSQPAATAITDIDEVQPTITINDQPITPSSLQFSISDNAEEAIEEIDITLPE